MPARIAPSGEAEGCPFVVIVSKPPRQQPTARANPGLASNYCSFGII
jgi:hypothetical protein